MVKNDVIWEMSVERICQLCVHEEDLLFRFFEKIRQILSNRQYKYLAEKLNARSD